jgi:hypothetical protein
MEGEAWFCKECAVRLSEFQTAIGKILREEREVLEQPLPERLTDLLRELDRALSGSPSNSGESAP